MGRETIAGLIAGILQKYSHDSKEEQEEVVLTDPQVTQNLSFLRTSIGRTLTSPAVEMDGSNV